MIEHIVLLRCKEGVTDAKKEEIIQFARSMKAEIKELHALSAGLNWSERGDGYQLALVGRFADRAALDAYQIHPYHQRFVSECVKPNIEKVLAIDYFI